MSRYAVTWREPDGRTFVGSLALGRRALRLVGRLRGAEGTVVERRFRYAELGGVRVGSRADRLDGRAVLVVERPDGVYRLTGVGTGVPIVHELVDRLVPLAGRGNPAV